MNKISYEWAEYRKIATLWARLMQTAFSVQTLEGVASGEAGDYLCRGLAGEEWPMSRQIFENNYILVTAAFAASQWQEYRKLNSTILARPMPEAFVVETLHGRLYGKAGDYLCQSLDGRRWPVAATIFAVSYELVVPN